MALAKQLPKQVGANETSAPSEQDPHRLLQKARITAISALSISLVRPG